MSQWDKRILEHGIWTVLASIGPTIDHALQREGITPDAIGSLERLRTVLAFTGKRLAGTDPALVVPSVLDTLNKTLTELNENLTNFTSNGDIAQLNSANTSADSALATLSSIVGPTTPDELTAISHTTATYRSTLEKHLRDATIKQQELAAKNQANEQKILAIEDALDKEQQRLTGLTTEQQSQFSAAQDKRSSEFATAQAEYLAKYAAAAAEQQTQFSSEQDSRRTTFSTFQTESQQRLVSLMAEYDEVLKNHEAELLKQEKEANDTHNAYLATLQTEYKASASKILDEIQSHQLAVEKLVGVIGNLGVTSGYQKVANNARLMLYLWQFLTVCALGLLVFIAITMAFPGIVPSSTATTATHTVEARAQIQKQAEQQVATTSEVHISDSDFYRGLAVRIFLSMTCIVFAAYSARQARHFLSIESKNRKRALELEAVKPYIATLEKSAQDEFLVKLGERSFGVSDLEHTKLDADPVSIADAIKPKVIGEYFREVWKGFKG